MASPACSGDVISKFIDMSQETSCKRTAEDYRIAWMQEKDPDIAKIRQMAYDVQGQGHLYNAKKSPRGKIESAGFHQKIRVEFTTQKCDGFFICHLFIHGLLVASKEGKKMKESRGNAYEDALHKISMPYLRIVPSDVHAKSLEASLRPFSSSPPRPSAFPSTVCAPPSDENKESNMKDLKNRGKGSGYKPINNFVILEPKNDASDKNVDAIMRRSANMNELLLEYEYFFNSDTVRCVLRLEDQVLADVMESTKAKARAAASTSALQKLQKSCWTIKTKETGPISNTISDTNIVTRDELRKGISEGVTGEFRKRVSEVIGNYASSDIEASLTFTCDFNPAEEKVIRKGISKEKLRVDTVKKDGKRYICVWRPYNKLFAFLQSVGGETKQYRLVPPTTVSQNFESLATGNSGSQLASGGLSTRLSPSVLSSGCSQDATPIIEPWQEGISSEDQASLETVKKWPPPQPSGEWQSGRSPDEWTLENVPSSSHARVREADNPHISQSSSPPLAAGHESEANEIGEDEAYWDQTELVSVEKLQKIFILENMGIGTDKQLLQDTANFNKLLIKYKYEKLDIARPDLTNHVRCHVIMGENVIAASSAYGKANSLLSACKASVERLNKYCWRIIVKQTRDDVQVVGRSVFCRECPRSDSGYSVPYTQSSSFPSTPHGPGLGGQMMNQTFDNRKVKDFLETLVRSGNTQGLIFRDEFSAPEVQHIQTVCIKVNLHFNVFHKRGEKFYYLSRKWTAQALFRHLQKLGGESDDHKLVPPLGENGDTPLGAKPVDSKPVGRDATVRKSAAYGASCQSNREGDGQQGPSLQESHVNTQRDAEGCLSLSLQEDSSYAPRNVDQGSTSLQTGSFRNYPRNSDQVPNLQGHNSYSSRQDVQSSSWQESSSKDSGYSHQASSLQEHNNDYNPSRNVEQGSSFMESDSYNYYNARSSEYDSRLRENCSSYPRVTEQCSKESEEMRLRNTDYDYRHSSQREKHSYKPRNDDVDYGRLNWEESHNYRRRNIDDDHHSSSQGESHSYRRRTTGDNFHGSSRGESHNDRQLDTYDDFRGSSHRGRHSYRHNDSYDDYRGSNDRESHNYRQRDFNDYGSSRADNNSYKPRHESWHRSGYSEKRKYEEQETWREENSSPHKFRRGYQSGRFHDEFMY